MLPGRRLGGCTGGSPRSSIPRFSPHSLATGDPRVPPSEGHGDIRVGLATRAGLGREASAEGQRLHFLAGCPAARHHPGINREKLCELRREIQQRTWLRSSLLAGVGAEVTPG